MSTTFTARTLCTVRPYLRQCSPPEFSATFPPMEHAICEEGVRRVVEPVRIGRLGDGEVADPRLHPGDAAVGVQLEDAAELREAEEQPVLEGEGAPGKAGPGPAGDHRHALRRRDPHDPLHFLDPIGENRHHRKAAIDGESVAFERAELFGLGEDRLARQEDEELGGELLPSSRARAVVESKGGGAGHRITFRGPAPTPRSAVRTASRRDFAQA